MPSGETADPSRSAVDAGGPREPGGQISLVVISPVRLYREGLAMLLANSLSRVVATGRECAELPDMVRGARPDLALVDATLLQATGALDAARHVQAELPIIAFGIREDVAAILSCTRAGVRGYVSRDATASELHAVLNGVRRDGFGCSQSLAAVLLQHVATAERDPRSSCSRARSVPTPRAAEGSGGLSHRELEIAALMSEGLMNKQIARRLGLSLSTVKNHVHNILRKQGVASRQQVTRLTAGTSR